MVGEAGRAGFAVLACAGWAVACGGKHSSSAPVDSEAGAGARSSGSAAAQAGTSSSLAGNGTASGGAPGRPPSGRAGAPSVGGAGGAGGAGGDEVLIEFDARRSGPFKALVYSRTVGFRHAASIESGQEMLRQIGNEQGFEVITTETNELFTPAGLREFELVFFLNTSGDVFNEAEELVFEEWMTRRNGAFAGVHTATDTESSWDFYLEVTGQSYDGHGNQNTVDDIVLEASGLTHPAVAGLPNPWPRAEEWMRFNSHLVWTAKPGFRVLGRKSADAQPIIWLREWGNFRSFYSGLGHSQEVFQDPVVKQHITGGVMWTVRREHLIK